MAKTTQAFILFNMLKAAGTKGVSKGDVAKALNVRENSVPVYFFGMKKLYNAKIETIKNGRQVVAYKLLNPNEVSGVPETRGASKGNKPLVKAGPKKATKVVQTKVKATKPTKAKKTSDDTPILDKEMKIAEITDQEFADIKTSLGLI